MYEHCGSIIKADALFVENSGVVIDWSAEYETVTIGDYALLQGHEASALIDLAKRIYDEAGDVSMTECMLSVCKLYVEVCVD